MPKLQATVTTKTEVKITTKLRTLVTAKLARIAQIRADRAKLDADLEDEKAQLEMAFHNADATEALTNGIKLGDITVKLHTGGKTRTLNKTKLMKAYKLPVDAFEKCTDEKPKKDYIGVYFPGDRGAE